MRPRSTTAPLLALLLVGCDDELNINVGAGGGGDTVQQVFESNCVTCHSADAPTSGLNLETGACESIVDGDAAGYDGVLVSPGDLDASVLWQKMSGNSDYGGVMPPGGPLGEDTLAIVSDWIEAGADCADFGDPSGGDTADAAGAQSP